MSRLVAARGGYDLMPEMGYRPTNKYLPPRAAQRSPWPALAPALEDASPAGRLPRLARPRARRLTARMHPASSLIAFTVLSGAGYGLLVVLGLLAALGAADGRLARRRRRRHRPGAGITRACCLDRPSRPPRAGLARVQPVAHPPGCRARASPPAHLPAGAGLGAGSGCSTAAPARLLGLLVSRVRRRRPCSAPP